MEHKIETLVAAPAAVEEALASLIVDHQDPMLQYRALLTYIKRVYHPFLLREPQARGGGERGQGGREGALTSRCCTRLRGSAAGTPAGVVLELRPPAGSPAHLPRAAANPRPRAPDPTGVHRQRPRHRGLDL